MTAAATSQGGCEARGPLGVVLRTMPDTSCKVLAVLWGKNLKEGLANHGPWATSSPPPACANKVLLEPHRTHLFMLCLRLPPSYKGRVE